MLATEADTQVPPPEINPVSMVVPGLPSESPPPISLKLRVDPGKEEANWFINWVNLDLTSCQGTAVLPPTRPAVCTHRPTGQRSAPPLSERGRQVDREAGVGKAFPHR